MHSRRHPNGCKFFEAKPNYTTVVERKYSTYYPFDYAEKTTTTYSN